jgi:hypothetical protein
MKNIQGFWRISLRVRRGEELVGRILCGDMSRRAQLSSVSELRGFAWECTLRTRVSSSSSLSSS